MYKSEEKLLKNYNKNDIAFNLMPEYFTLGDL